MTEQTFKLSTADLRYLTRRAVATAMRELAARDDRRLVSIVRRIAAAVPRKPG